MQHPKELFILSMRSTDIAAGILLLCSLLFCFRRYNPSYMRSVPLYCLVNFLPGVLRIPYPAQEYWFEFCFTICELLYFTYFFCTILRPGSGKYVVIGCCLSFLTGFSFLGLRGINLATVFAAMYIMVFCECFLFVGVSVQYLRQLSDSRLILTVTAVPAFWMVEGIFFYFMVLGPALIFSILAVATKHTLLGQAMYAANNFAQLISSSLFIVAMLCSKKNL
jgi:hypothetical protein